MSSALASTARRVAISGWCATPFRPLAAAFIDNFARRGEIGASMSLYYKGQHVVHLWGGHAELPKSPSSSLTKVDHRIWEENTLVNCYSCTKGVVNALLGLAISRGYASYNDPIAKHWPEFGINGKQHITIAHLVSHQAGLAALDEPTRISLPFIARAQNVGMDESKDDMESMTHEEAKRKLHDILTRQAPNWTFSDGKFGYSPLLIGLYMSELLPRIDPKHRSLRQFLKEELATPLGLEFHLGIADLDPADNTRIAKLYQMTPSSPIVAAVVDDTSITPATSDSKASITITLPTSTPPMGIMAASTAQRVTDSKAFVRAWTDQSSLTNRAFRAISGFSPWSARHLEIPSAVGFTSSRSLARLYYALASSYHTDSALYKCSTIHSALEPVSYGLDQVLLDTDSVCTRGGWWRHSAAAGAFYHGGAGGSIGLGDWYHQLGFSYTPNALAIGNQSPRREALITALYQCLNQSNSRAAAVAAAVSSSPSSSSSQTVVSSRI